MAELAHITYIESGSNTETPGFQSSSSDRFGAQIRACNLVPAKRKAD